MGDDPMHVMMRQIMALFDEYQSKENAKHVLRALRENARQGFWNGSLPPIGYRMVDVRPADAALTSGNHSKNEIFQCSRARCRIGRDWRHEVVPG